MLKGIVYLVAMAWISSAQAQSVTLDLINEYPATAISGEADAFFADAVKRRSEGRIAVNLIPDAKSGLRSRDQLKAVSEGRFAMANSVGGTLGGESPVFLLSSLPFVTPSMTDARILYELSLPLYEQLFAERKQKLLYVVPWPPSGIWSAVPLGDAAALRALKVRTYDETGTNVLARIASSASIVSFSELTPKLESGEINAVLSSGDGGAGRQLWKFLRYFSDINYAVPLSFASISLAEWDGLDDAGRAAMAEAARETTERQWTMLATRLADNVARMKANGVVIDAKPPADVMEALRAAAASSLTDWLARAGPEARQVYETYRKAR
jgi:TRAP-type C4-dicarboxylate transport system substrate-binding protein